MSVALAIDGHNYIATYFNGTGGQASAPAALRSLVRDYRRRYHALVAIAFDAPGPTWRHAIYPAYKGQRGAKDPGLVDQLAEALEWATMEGFLYPPVNGYEADDLLAMFAIERTIAGDRVVICSRDHDLRQLLADGEVSILKKASHAGGEWRYEYYTSAMLWMESGLTPQQWPDYRALIGDKSDNWPGAEGIGPKTARAILDSVGSLEAAMANLWQLPITDRQRDALRAFDWKLGLRLMRLQRGMNIDVHGGVLA